MALQSLNLNRELKMLVNTGSEVRVKVHFFSIAIPAHTYMFNEFQ